MGWCKQLAPYLLVSMKEIQVDVQVNCMKVMDYNANWNLPPTSGTVMQQMFVKQYLWYKTYVQYQLTKIVLPLPIILLFLSHVYVCIVKWFTLGL